MEQKQTKRKPKRILKDINFENDSAHLALVHRDQGGAANLANYKLVVKSTNEYSEEFLQKASEVTVRLEITEYLRTFFNLADTQAEILARSLGYTTAGQEKAALEQQEEMLDEQEPPEYPEWDSQPGDKDFERYVESKVQSIQVMKSLYEAESIPEALSKLDEEQYLAFLQDQEMLEKAFKKVEQIKQLKEEQEEVNKACKDKSTKPVKKYQSVDSSAEDTAPQIASEVKEEGNPSVVNKSSKEKRMTKEAQGTNLEELLKSAENEKIELKKALEDQQVQLQKAMEAVAKFEAEKKEAIQKARKEQVQKAVEDKDAAEVISKAALLVEDEGEFQAVVKALETLVNKAQQKELFVEKGATVEAEQKQENALEKILKAKYSK